MLRVAVVVDRPVYASLLAGAIDAEPGLRHVPLDGDGDVDVLLVDLTLPPAALADTVLGLRARRPDARLVLVGDVFDRALLLTARSAYVATLLDRSAEWHDVLAAIRAADDAITVLSASAVEQARGQLRGAPERAATTAYPRLTDRELDVLTHLVRGQGPTAIAAALRISVNTCRGYLRSLMAKLGVRSQLEVLAFVARHGLPPERS